MIKKQILVTIIIVILLASTLIMSSCSAQNYSGFAFGTTYELKLLGGKYKTAGAEIIAMFEDVENSISTNIETSYVSKINSAELNEPIVVDDITIELFQLSETVYASSGGAFDVSCYPLVELWGFDTASSYIENIREEIPVLHDIWMESINVGLDKFVLDRENNTITKTITEAKLGFGGIAKGYVVSRAMTIAEEYGVTDAIINVGGNVGRIGIDIIVGVNNPRPTTSVAFASFAMKDGETISTSGDYNRYFIYEDDRYSHIINPISGYPVYTSPYENEDVKIISVTVISDEGGLADAYSTAIFVKGVTEGLAFAESKGVKYLIIMDNNTYYLSSELEIDLLEANYSLATLDE